MGSSKDVGIFGVANRIAQLTSFILIAVNSIVAPKFADLYSRGDMMLVEQTARNSSKQMTMFSCPLLLLLIIFPTQIMRIFGPHFSDGAIILTLLAIGQFVNVVTGSVGYLLMMTGNEKIMRNIIGICAGTNIALNLLLIPLLGIMGAAISTAVTLSLQNLIAVFFVWKIFGIKTIPLLCKSA